MTENKGHPKYVFLSGLIREFNNRLAFPARCDLYNQLYELHVLGKVFSKNARDMLRPYLFETENNKHWHELVPFHTHNNDETEERRVNLFLDMMMDKRRQVDPDEDYETTREVKAKQLYLLFREMKYRDYLITRAEGQDGITLGYLPCTWGSLRKIRKAYPRALVVEDLWAATVSDYIEKGLTKVTATRVKSAIQGMIQRKRRQLAPKSVARRMDIAEAAGQTAFF